MEIEHLIDNMLESIDWTTACQHSFINFHAPGLSYVNLLRTERLTLKLYTFNNVQHNALGYLVHPHNHAYNFTHRTLVGKVQNYTFSLCPGKYWNMYSFSTPLNGGSGLTRMLPCQLFTSSAHLYNKDESYYLDHNQIHTISIATDYAAALLLQFHDVEPGHPTIMFAPKDEAPECDKDLYHPMSTVEGRDIVERFRDAEAEEISHA